MKKIFPIFTLYISLMLLSACNPSTESKKETSEDSSTKSVGAVGNDSVVPEKQGKEPALVQTETKETPKPIPVPLAPKGKTALGLFKGQIFTKSNYCGGAAPSKEILEQARRPVALQNTKFYLKPGNTNNNLPFEISFTTDANGKFNIEIPYGDWILATKEHTVSNQLHPELYPHKAAISDMNSYKNWWRTGLFALELPANGTVEKTLTFEVRCMVNSICPFIENPDSKLLP